VTVVVTGADGQLAYAIRSRMGGEHHVVALTRSDLDLTDYAAVDGTVRELRPAVIINTAAYNDVDGAEDDQVRAMAVNAFGVRALARAAVAVGATFVHYSTDFVFDGTAAVPYTEESTPNPQSVYATSKLLGEWFASAEGGGDAPHYVLRVESVFGGGAQIRQDGPPRGSSLDRLTDAMLRGQEVRAFEDRTVSPSYVDDVASATSALLASSAPPGLYHCVGSGMGTWVDVANELALRLGRPARIIPTKLTDLTLKASRPLFCALSNAKLARLGITMPSWQDAVARYAAARLALC
jgi:dTDP-4-dehydrorhamnose reductase